MRRVLTTLMILLVVLVAGLSALVLLVNPTISALTWCGRSRRAVVIN